MNMKRAYCGLALVLAVLGWGCQFAYSPYLVNGYDNPCVMKVYNVDREGVEFESPVEFVLGPWRWIGRGRTDFSVRKIEVYDLEQNLLQTVDESCLQAGFASGANHSASFALVMSTEGARWLSKKEFKKKGFHYWGYREMEER